MESRKPLDAHRIVYLASEAGKILLESGAEIYRVEETIILITSAYGLAETESFVTPTGIMVSTVDTEGNTITRVRNIESRTVNLGRIADINGLVASITDRRLKPLSPDLLESGLMAVREAPPHPLWSSLAAAAVVGGAFASLFGGGGSEVVSGACAGGLARGLVELLARKGINDFFINMCGSALITVFCMVMYFFGLVGSPHEAIIGSLMLFVPGLAITNSIRDTLAGDLLSGLARGVEAVFIAVAVAIGSGMALEMASLAKKVFFP
jgi:uncharacterized membrane protein YjjP (DUF1212 family)